MQEFTWDLSAHEPLRKAIAADGTGMDSTIAPFCHGTRKRHQVWDHYSTKSSRMVFVANSSSVTIEWIGHAQ